MPKRNASPACRMAGYETLKTCRKTKTSVAPMQRMEPLQEPLVEDSIMRSGWFESSWSRKIARSFAEGSGEAAKNASPRMLDQSACSESRAVRFQACQRARTSKSVIPDTPSARFFAPIRNASRQWARMIRHARIAPIDGSCMFVASDRMPFASRITPRSPRRQAASSANRTSRRP